MPPITPRQMFTCESCEHEHRVDERRIAPNDDHYCNDCYNEHASSCDSCDGSVWRDDMCEYRGEYFCEDCHSERTSNDDNETIKDYGHKPTPIFHRVAGDELQPTLGIELEVERMASEIDQNRMARQIAKPHHYFKTDGSIENGFEIVTHPMTEDWIKAHKPDFSEVLGHLRNAKYKSYQTSTCGIHIHVSRDSFSTWHLYRFMKFFYENKRFILLISQRKEENLNQWAKLGIGEVKDIMRMAKKKYCSRDRYTAINLSTQTVEIRIFRGTLHEGSFFKNIEFVTSLFKFTSLFNADKIQPPQYFKWLKHNANKYPNLVNYLTVKSELMMQMCGYTYGNIKDKAKEEIEQ